MRKHIVILASLDTKGEEAEYLKGLIDARGFKTLLLDTSIGGEPTVLPDISAEEVARLGGATIQELRASRNTGHVTPIMIKGATLKVQELAGRGLLDGIIAFGGASNTTSEQLVRDDQRPNRVVACPPSRVSDHVCVAFAEARVLRGIESGVHAREDRKPTRRWERQRSLPAELVGVRLVRGQHLIENRHGDPRFP